MPYRKRCTYPYPSRRSIAVCLGSVPLVSYSLQITIFEERSTQCLPMQNCPFVPACFSYRRITLRPSYTSSTTGHAWSWVKRTQTSCVFVGLGFVCVAFCIASHRSHCAVPANAGVTSKKARVTKSMRNIVTVLSLRD